MPILRDPHRHGACGSTGKGPRHAGDARLIFVTGASRSGTTLLARMLGAHSDVFTCDELHFFGDLCEPSSAQRPLTPERSTLLGATLLARQARGLWCGRPTHEEIERAARLLDGIPAAERSAATVFGAIMIGLSAEAGASRVCEQTPRNIFYAERLLDLYPQARVIHILRDPRAVLASQKNRWRMRQLGARHLPIAEMIRTRINYHPITVSRLWRNATEAASRLAGHPRVLLVRFEDLVAEPERHARSICDFAGIGFEPAMLELQRWGSSNLPHNAGETGLSREVVEQWRNRLSTGERLICERMTRRQMERFQYAVEARGVRNVVSMLPSMLAFPLHALGVVLVNPGRAMVQLKAVLRAERG